jgi:hypothetical protein
VTFSFGEWYDENGAHKNGVGYINGDLLEADFWPGIISA